MFKSKILASCAVLLLAAAASGCSLASQPATVSNIDGSAVQWAFTQADQHPDQVLEQQINTAQKTLDIAIYSLTEKGIVQSILDAKKRGVKVRLITDKQQMAGKSQAEQLKNLAKAGIPIKYNSHSGLMHLKVSIIDGTECTTGSFNYSNQASTDNDEVLLVVKDPKATAAFQAQFDRMWSDTKGFKDYK
ncbi:phospholipase D-like domain-containing protein [Tumebacillus flagellatus]|uniref:phospholipase D n=1 Tax=Tumebacillus flagellatus TaxID=1157490 RepID=A0A074LQ27_9BACL|nr:phospholipase D-like domain-containing protein [Tumebacillus flagellatus]KEO84241.1 hypothetical protein EL26_05605 [Tumebacillus flagellatus]